MDKINIKYDGKDYKFNKGVTVLDVSESVYKGKYPVLAAFIDNEIVSLDKKLLVILVLNLLL